MKYELKDTIDWMLSDDFKLRLKAEYWQLVIRMDKLRVAIHKLNIREVTCAAPEIMHSMAEQFGYMQKYKHELEYRCAGLEVDLDNEEIALW